MTNSTKIEQTAIIADVCSIELFRKLASKFWNKEKKSNKNNINFERIKAVNVVSIR